MAADVYKPGQCCLDVYCVEVSDQTGHVLIVHELGKEDAFTLRAHLQSLEAQLSDEGAQPDREPPDETKPKWVDLFGIDPEYSPTESMIMDRITKLVESGWRVNLGYEYDTVLDAYAAGRNQMIDVIRMALDGADVSAHYPFSEQPRDNH